ncbi:hypothetical protein CPARK_000072500 [cyanobacterium endosymbiont of Braarudosphaera bigelowii]|uniref:Uncharacterized protein n=2 Tax=Candidatus Atelocyanobacterium thalassae TaxID=713887 RepID=A0A086CIQ7_9CHRO|nr:MAG: hypothetical protein ucyna2_00133 [Candidatus Atelocyanobacterium thalassa isolate SIO64986]BDA39885.1 hypothetical protein CPARK_000072500 [cyanobacterium endosymbiont of Braarudosphaera bigelowii]
MSKLVIMSILKSITYKSHNIKLKKQPIRTKSDQIILCLHCKRTVDNNIKCKGICVSDNDY